MNKIRVLFMGTPDLARTCLEHLYAKEGVEIAAVVTRADKQKGRGMKFVFSPVKEFALEHSIPVYQPRTMRDGSFDEDLRAIDPDVIIVAAYGNILPKHILDYPKYGCICAHGSLLPKYRGASPIQRAVIDGEKETGITAMLMDEGVDTGDIIKMYPCPITEEDDFGTVHDKLAIIAGEAMCDVIDMIREGELPHTPQPEEGSCYAAKIEREDTVVDFSRSPREVVNLIRGLSPMPYAVTKLPNGQLLKLTNAKAEEGTSDAPCGTVVELQPKGEGEIIISCGGGLLAVTGVVPEGKKKMAAGDFIRGRKISVGDLLSY